MQAVWKKVTTLREAPVSLAGQYYPRAYARTHHLPAPCNTVSLHNGIYVASPEMVEVSLDDNGTFLCRPAEYVPMQICENQVFRTSAGQFLSKDCGEFGGLLITPTGCLHGNFVTVFECCGKTYAIDTLRHLLHHQTILYEFTENLDAVPIFEAIPHSLPEPYDSLALCALYQSGDSVFILVSGSRVYPETSQKSEPLSYLLELNEHGLSKRLTLHFTFHYVQNIVVCNNTLAIGSDKVAILIDFATKEMTGYTLISPDAQANLSSLDDLR